MEYNTCRVPFCSNYICLPKGVIEMCLMNYYVIFKLHNYSLVLESKRKDKSEWRLSFSCCSLYYRKQLASQAQISPAITIDEAQQRIGTKGGSTVGNRLSFHQCFGLTSGPTLRKYYTLMSYHKAN